MSLVGRAVPDELVDPPYHRVEKVALKRNGGSLLLFSLVVLEVYSIMLVCISCSPRKVNCELSEGGSYDWVFGVVEWWCDKWIPAEDGVLLDIHAVLSVDVGVHGLDIVEVVGVVSEGDVLLLEMVSVASVVCYCI